MQQNEGGDERQTLSQSRPLTGLHVLVVDDEADTRDLLRFILVEAGAIVTVTASAPAALEALDQSCFQVLLSDIAMPGMDGYMLLQQVRSRTPETGGTTPAIALTAYASEADQERAIALGFQKHIAKPVDPSELVAIVAVVAMPTL
jgi:CheY-like chemotaxis protein